MMFITEVILATRVVIENEFNDGIATAKEVRVSSYPLDYPDFYLKVYFRNIVSSGLDIVKRITRTFLFIGQMPTIDHFDLQVGA